MMPHIRSSVSHAPGYAREIYLPQPVNGVLEPPVPQQHAHHAARLAHRSYALRRHTQLLRERRHRGGALGVARHHRPPVGLAEEQLGSRKQGAVGSEIDVEPNPVSSYGPPIATSASATPSP